MRKHGLIPCYWILFALLILVLACNMPVIPQTGGEKTPSAGPPTATGEPQTATFTLTLPPTGTNTPLPDTPTNTLTATSTLIPITPTNTSIPVPCNKAEYVADVNYPDGTEINAGTNFTKTWRLANSGSCTWTSGYKIIYVSGDQMGAPAETTLTGGTVPPGAVVDISVSMKAPSAEGTYKGYYRIKSSENIVFGIGSSGNEAFWVEIKSVGIHLYFPAVPFHAIPTKTPTSIFKQMVPIFKITLHP